MSDFAPNCLPLLIGSLPFEDHAKATELIFDHTTQLPLWPQLPVHKQEGMILQYMAGLPGITEVDGRVFINNEGPDFDAQIIEFYEEYLMISEGGAPLEGSRFELSEDVAKGFFTFLEAAENNKGKFTGLKGQTTGPITFCIGLVDKDDRAIFYDDQLRDVAIKHLALKAKWQTRKMAECGGETIMFFDEPGLAGLGSSAFITITKEDIVNSLSEVFEAVRAEGGLTGVHVCANTEWPVIFESGVDIVSFDAYSYFDRLILYKEHLIRFFAKGGILASGIIPTTSEFIDVETEERLVEKWLDQCKQLVGVGIEESVIYKQTLITPSCGVGTVSEAHARKVLELTKNVSERVRAFL